jgi:FkbM family methyltransferase
MKKVYNYWLPDTDNHFEKMIKKRIRNGGPAEYQDEIRDLALSFVKNFDIAVDVGANVGLWARPMASKFKKVIAFEPVSNVYECLEENVKTLPVEIHKHALGNINGNVTIEVTHSNTGNSFVSDTSGGDIVIKKLDDMKLPNFGFIKIDCEGHELEIVKGGTDTLLEYKPIIVVEQHPNVNLSSVEYLKSIGAVTLGSLRKDHILGWK